MAELPHLAVAAGCTVSAAVWGASGPVIIAEMADIRASGICVVRDELIAGISAMAVPVFDGFGKLALVIAAIAPTSTMDLLVHGNLARTLRDAGERMSARLGNVRA